MGKLKEHYTSMIENPINDSKQLDQDYELYLRRKYKGYISSEEFDLMTEDELHYYYGKPESSLERKQCP